MTVLNPKDTQLDAFILRTEAYLDNVVEHGDDQALFIASYLQGHFAVAAGQSQVRKMTQIAELAKLMDDSLTSAFDNNELAVIDKQQVLKLWQLLLKS